MQNKNTYKIYRYRIYNIDYKCNYYYIALENFYKIRYRNILNWSCYYLTWIKFLLSFVVNEGIWVVKGSKTMERRGVGSIRRRQEFYCQADNEWEALPPSRCHDSWVLRERCRRVRSTHRSFFCVCGFTSSSRLYTS